MIGTSSGETFKDRFDYMSSQIKDMEENLQASSGQLPYPTTPRIPDIAPGKPTGALKSGSLGWVQDLYDANPEMMNRVMEQVQKSEPSTNVLDLRNQPEPSASERAMDNMKGKPIIYPFED